MSDWCWYGEPHGPFVRRGVGVGTSEGTQIWGPLECVPCGAVVREPWTPTVSVISSR